jgi:Bacteriophage baseplate protein W
MRAERHRLEHLGYADTREGDVMQVDYPFHMDGRGRTAETETDDHIRDMIEQVLFTAPGERVNRPSFGTGLQQLLFAPNSGELATATQFLIQGALQQWLDDLIQVEAVQVDSRGEVLTVTVQYVVRRNLQKQVAQFTQPGAQQ